jgi:hypothetical protein
MEIDKLTEGADIVRFMAGTYPKNGPSKTS